MATIEIRSIDRRTGSGEREQTQVTGAIRVNSTEAAVPAGSFGLRHLTAIQLTTSYPTKRGLIGSVAAPLGNYGNSVRLSAMITGSTGSRTTTLAMLGSPAGAGTLASGYFTVWGY